MGRGKGSVNRNKEAAAANASAVLDDNGMIGRRSFMEQIHPYPTLPAKRTHAEVQHQNSHHPLSLKLTQTTARWAKSQHNQIQQQQKHNHQQHQHQQYQHTQQPHPRSSPTKRPRTQQHHHPYAPTSPTATTQQQQQQQQQSTSKDQYFNSRDNNLSHVGSLMLNPEPFKLEPYPHPSSSMYSSSSIKLKNPQIPNLLYTPLRILDTSSSFHSPNLRKTYARIHIPVEHLTMRNVAVMKANIWGYKNYTEDSDIVAILIHSGYFPPLIKPPDTYQYLSVLIEINKFQKSYYVKNKINFERKSINGISSKEWPSSHYEGKSTIKVSSIAKVRSDCAMVPSNSLRRKEIRLRVPKLIPWDIARKQSLASSTSGSASNANTNNNKPNSNNHKVTAKRSCLIGGLMSFDMINEPCLLYDLKEVGHLYHSDSMLYRLRREVLYVENDKERWEFALVDGDGDGTHVRVGKLNDQVIRDLRIASFLNDHNDEDDEKSQKNQDDDHNNDDKDDNIDDDDNEERIIKKRTSKKNVKLTVPLSSKKVDIIAKRMLWTDLVWDLQGVLVNGKHLKLTKMSFRDRSA